MLTFYIRIYWLIRKLHLVFNLIKPTSLPIDFPHLLAELFEELYLIYSLSITQYNTNLGILMPSVEQFIQRMHIDFLAEPLFPTHRQFQLWPHTHFPNYAKKVYGRFYHRRHFLCNNCFHISKTNGNKGKKVAFAYLIIAAGVEIIHYDQICTN